MTDSQDGDNTKFTIQSISISVAGLIASALNGIIAYIAVYFFKPLWEKFINYWNKSK